MALRQRQAEKTRPSERPDLLPVNGGVEGLRRVLDQDQIVLATEFGDAIRLGRRSPEMRQQEHPRAGRQTPLGPREVRREGLRKVIDEDGAEPGHPDRLHHRINGEGAAKDLRVGGQTKSLEHLVKTVADGGNGHGVPDAEPSGKLPLEPLYRATLVVPATHRIHRRAPKVLP
jgi:hypothetical protein